MRLLFERTVALRAVLSGKTIGVKTFMGVYRIRPCELARGCMSEMMEAP